MIKSSRTASEGLCGKVALSTNASNIKTDSIFQSEYTVFITIIQFLLRYNNNLSWLAFTVHLTD